MAVPFVKVLSFEELMEFFGGADLPVASIFLRMEGDLSGSIFSLCPLSKQSNL